MQTTPRQRQFVIPTPDRNVTACTRLRLYARMLTPSTAFPAAARDPGNAERPATGLPQQQTVTGAQTDSGALSLGRFGPP